MRKIALVVGSNLLSNGLDKTNDILACNRAKWIISQHERLPFKDGNPNSYTAIVVYDLVLPNTTVLCRVKVTEFHMSSNPTVETTSKTSCSYHFALINLEESKGSFTSVSNTLFTLWVLRGLPPFNSSLITEIYHSFNSSHIR